MTERIKASISIDRLDKVNKHLSTRGGIDGGEYEDWESALEGVKKKVPIDDLTWRVGVFLEKKDLDK